MFRGAHRGLASQFYDRSKDGVVANAHDAKPKTRWRQTMKMIMTALGAAALLAASLPACADTGVAELVEEVARGTSDIDRNRQSAAFPCPAGSP